MDLLKSLSDLTAEAVAQFQKAAQTPIPPEKLGDLAKTINQATGLTWYDLQAPAKNLFPVLTPLRNRIPRVPGNGGTATNWKAVTGINTTGIRGAVPEGRRNGVVTTTVNPVSANYKRLGLEDAVTLEAELAAVNFENVRATTAQRLLWATMIEEEIFDLGGNNSAVALGTPTAPTVTHDTTGGTIADGTYLVRVVALTLHGLLSSTVSATGVVGSVSVTNPTGYTFTYGGGSSIKSGTGSSGAISASSTNVLYATTPVVNGAAGYAWFVDDGAAGTMHLQAITTNNSVKLTSLVTTTQALSTQFDADHSQNAYGYDGLLYQAYAPGSNAYIKALATGTPGTGTPLTADGKGRVVEIDAMLDAMWANYRLGPTTIYLNSKDAIGISGLILSSTTARFDFITQNPSSDIRDGMMAPGRVKIYPNTAVMSGGPDLILDIHPNMPRGTMLAVTDALPYPLTDVPNVYEKKLRRDYFQIEWPQREMMYESGVYFDGVLAHYFPPSMGIITNFVTA